MMRLPFRIILSPVIASESAPAPAFDPLRCVPSTAPGSRLPHVFLGEDRALYDELGDGLSLLVLGDHDVGRFVGAAEKMRLPLSVVHLKPGPHLDVLEHPLILVRPDHHVAWRGAVVPDSVERVLGVAAGRH